MKITPDHLRDYYALTQERLERAGTIELPVRTKRRNETTIVRRALVELNRIPGVRATRNNVGKSPCACGACVPKLCPRCRARLTRPIAFGLGVGSPDVVGIYSLALEGGAVLALAFAIEFKSPTARRKRDHEEQQEAWRTVATRRGIRCVKVTSSEAATLAVLGWIQEWRRSLRLSLPASGSASLTDTR